MRFVSPASTPAHEGLERSAHMLRGFGLNVEIASHALDVHRYMAGTDEHRLADLNDALRDPHVRAIFATRGGKGAYRIADGMDFAAAQADPKILLGFSEITILHMAVLKHAGVAAIHGAPWDAETFGSATAASFRQAVFTTDPVTIRTIASSIEPTAALTTSGTATGRLIGGNQDSIATAAGWALPSFDGAILLLESVNMRLGHIDRQLTMLRNGGHLQGIVGVAVGQYTNCGPEAFEPPEWSVIEVLRDRLCSLGVPVLGGLPIGHGESPFAVPIGTLATLDADAGVLQVAAAVC